eukprot:363687-Chlamydomonas_euryale.AAC.1
MSCAVMHKFAPISGPECMHARTKHVMHVLEVDADAPPPPSPAPGVNAKVWMSAHAEHVEHISEVDADGAHRHQQAAVGQRGLRCSTHEKQGIRRSKGDGAGWKVAAGGKVWDSQVFGGSLRRVRGKRAGGGRCIVFPPRKLGGQRPPGGSHGVGAASPPLACKSRGSGTRLSRLPYGRGTRRCGASLDTAAAASSRGSRRGVDTAPARAAAPYAPAPGPPILPPLQPPSPPPASPPPVCRVCRMVNDGEAAPRAPSTACTSNSVPGSSCAAALSIP